MLLYQICVIALSWGCALGGDITPQIFAKNTEGIPAAFGDFNSDELTDVFMLRDNGHSVEILLAHEEEPILRPAKPNRLICKLEKFIITSVVPGDFDGDAYMDVLVTAVKRSGDKHTHVIIEWGGGDHLNCSDESTALKIIGQPLAIDFNQDMIVDLFGENIRGRRTFWVYNSSRTNPEEIPMEGVRNRRGDGEVVETSITSTEPLATPHSNAFIDLNEDYMADLFLTTTSHFEVCWGSEEGESEVQAEKVNYQQQQQQNGRLLHYVCNTTIAHPPSAAYIGQAFFMDVELRGTMDLLLPVCYDSHCANSTILVYSKLAPSAATTTKGEWYNLKVNFKDDQGNLWHFFRRNDESVASAVTLRIGDFNMDGYPDLLATLVKDTLPQSFLLENVECTANCGQFQRSFKVKWNVLGPTTSDMAAFFDFYQDGILDVITVSDDQHQSPNSVVGQYKAAAFKNSLDYDANFIKVMVLTGLSNKNSDTTMGRVSKKRRTYGTNLPGPLISYKTTTQEGYTRHGAAAQIPQSAHFSLQLPYSIFGLGRTPNFVDSLTVGLSNHTRTWFQIIPNSQMVVIPWPANQPSRWKAQLFVTPSKLILMSVAALMAICGAITVIICVLHWKERQEDKKERLSESHRFHFDAM